MIHSRERMLGLATRPDRYRRVTTIPFRGVHTRVIGDVVAANLAPGSQILDIGTGPGTVPLHIARAAPQITVDGIDLSEPMIAYATTAALEAGCADRVTFHTADAGRMPFEDDSYDLIVSSMSQHHWSDVPAVIAEIQRVLRPGARAWIYDARFALRRAYAAAQQRFPGRRVASVPVQTGRLPVRVFARLSIES